MRGAKGKANAGTIEQRHWHVLPTEAVVSVVDSDSEKGLSNEEARRRLERSGENVLPKAKRRGARNFSLLVSHVLVPPAMEAILAPPNCRVNGFLAAGHVCTIMGLEEYRPRAKKYRVPIVATGFEPLDLLQGITMCLKQLEEGRAEVENQYERSVRSEGNVRAQAILKEVFEVVPRSWRGIGSIPASGLGLRAPYSEFDAVQKFRLEGIGGTEATECLSGLVLQGLLKPPDCPAFGTRCTPDMPLGRTMVSAEGACAAQYR